MPQQLKMLRWNALSKTCLRSGVRAVIARVEDGLNRIGFTRQFRVLLVMAKGVTRLMGSGRNVPCAMAGKPTEIL